jgi:hypothetical protein
LASDAELIAAGRAVARLCQAFRDLASMPRWNDKIRPMPLWELDKQAHKAVHAYFILKPQPTAFFYSQGLNQFHLGDLNLCWKYMFRVLLYDCLHRAYLTDLKRFPEGACTLRSGRGPLRQARLRPSLRDLGIQHTRTRPRHPWTNGVVERLQGTILNELWCLEFRRRFFTHVRFLQAGQEAQGLSQSGQAPPPRKIPARLPADGVVPILAAREPSTPRPRGVRALAAGGGPGPGGRAPAGRSRAL